MDEPAADGSMAVDQSPEKQPVDPSLDDAGWVSPPPSDVAEWSLDAAVSAPGPSSPSVRPMPPPEPSPVPSAADPFQAAAVCTSGTYWSGGASASMHPGHACIACHLNGSNRPKFKIAGTVYPTAHEPDDCNAQNPSGVRVEIVGADGRRWDLDVNAVGNFSSLAAVTLPYTARVFSQGKVRAMRSAQHSGDCNACHTQDGDHGAPGRILLP